MTQGAIGRRRAARARLSAAIPSHLPDDRPLCAVFSEGVGLSANVGDLRNLLTALDGDEVRDAIAAIIWDHLRPVEDTSPVADAILNAIIGEKPGD